MKRYVLVFGISLHFGIILWNNLQSSYYSYCRVTHQAFKVPVGVLRIGQQGLKLPLVLLYAKLSGTETAFGFFAPNVGSQYITEVVLYQADGRIHTLADPGLHQRESINRYSSFTRLFEPLLNASETLDKKKDLDQAYARALANSMAKRLGKRHPTVKQVLVSIYLYQSPTREDRNRQRPYLLRYQHQISL